MPGDKARIIIFCDADAGLVSIAQSLRSRSHEVTYVPSIYRAISLHSGDPADIIIVDANNFVDKEYEVFDIFRETHPGVKLFASISMTRRDKTPALLRCGIEGYFLEPFYADEILSAVERALRPMSVEQPATDTADKADKLASLGRLARGVAHQINNPLATLSGWVQFFLSERDENDPQHETLEVMQQEIERIEKVVQELLAFSGQPSPQRDQIDLNSMLRALLRTKERAGRKFAVKFADSLPPVFANQAQLRDSIGLLIDYCSSKQAANGTVEVITEADNSGAKTTIKAPSAKVEEKTMSSLFDPFYNGNGEASESELGLSIPYGVVKGLGGTLSADRDRGLSFVLTLPASTETAAKGK